MVNNRSYSRYYIGYRMMEISLVRYFVFLICFGFAFAVVNIVEGPRDQEVVAGGDVTMRCVVEGIPTGETDPVQWMIEGFGLGFSKNSSVFQRYSKVGDASLGEYNLRIERVALEDDTDYECQVTNYKKRSRKALLSVLVPPSGPFVDGIMGQEEVTSVDVVTEKENEITCRAFGGKPAADLKWLKNGQPIYDDVENAHSGPVSKLFNSSSTLRITPTSNDADDTYACVMTNDAMGGETRQKTIKLNLLEPPKVSVLLAGPIYEGDLVKAACRATADLPVTSYRWYIDGDLVESQVTSTYDLGVANKSWNNVQLGCEAQNKAGYSKQDAILVNVLYPPVLIDRTDAVYAQIGEDVTLRCEWDSNPKPLIRWIRDDDSSRVLGRSTVLTLTNVAQEDSGVYHCFAEKKTGYQNSSKLVVSGPPIFDSEPTQYALLQKEGTVVCSLSSYPGIQYVSWTWKKSSANIALGGNETRKDGNDKIKYRATFVPGSPTAKLQINNVNENDLRSYTCHVQNSYGEKWMAINLEKGTLQSSQVSTWIISAAAGACLLVVIALITCYCYRTKKTRKSTNFDKITSNTDSGDRKDEVIALNNGDDATSGAYVVRTTTSSSGTASTVSEPDEINPTPPSGQDDGYHTEEANSWNMNHNQTEKAELDHAPSFKKSPDTSYGGYVVNLPPLSEKAEISQPLYHNQYLNDPYLQQVPSSMATLPYGPPIPARSASVLGDQFSLLTTVEQPLYSEIPRVASPYLPTPVDAYPTDSAVHAFAPMLPVVDPMSGSAMYISRNRMTPVPQGYEQVTESLQSSLDKLDRESGSSIPVSRVHSFKPGRNLSSSLSQSSKASEMSRPFMARMATQV